MISIDLMRTLQPVLEMIENGSYIDIMTVFKEKKKDAFLAQKINSQQALIIRPLLRSQ